MRPASLVLALGAIYGVGALAVAIDAIAGDLDEVADGFVVWGGLWLLLGTPCACAIGLVGWRTERAVFGTAPSDRTAVGRRLWAWGLLSAGVVTAAHWAALGPWAPALVGQALLGPGSAVEHLGLAVGALLAWLFAVGGALLALVGRRILGLEPMASRSSVAPSTVPTSAVIGLVYGVSVVLPSLMWLSWLDDAWARGSGGIGILGWVLLGISSGVIAGAATGGWLVAAAPFAPWTTARPGLRQLEVAGALSVGHWVAPFLFCLLPIHEQNPDMRFTVLALSVLPLILGTSLWSFGRTFRALGSGGAAPA